MKKQFILYLFLLISPRVLHAAPSAITHEFSGGRFGDNLVSYCKGKWLAHKYKLPFYYRSFPYSEHLGLSTRQNMLTDIITKRFFSKVDLIKELNANIRPNSNTLYSSSYYLVPQGWNIIDGIMDIALLLKDAAFMTELRRDFAARHPLNLIKLPQKIITVALHVRKGTGVDHPLLSKQTYSDVEAPLKFPSDQFYSDQLRRLSEFFKNKPLYVFLFTDDPNPEALATKYSNAVNKPNITFDWRKHNNSHDLNVLEDFTSMQAFDCLIRPDSNFSKIVELIGTAKIVIYPHKIHWEDVMIIDEVKMIVKDQKWIAQQTK